MFRIYFFIPLFFLVVQATLGQQKNSVAILSRSKPDGIWLRWAPTSATYWKLGNKYGYTIERFTLTPTGDMEPNSKVTLTTDPLRPYTPAAFLPLSEQSDEVATLEELLYGEGSTTTYSVNDLSSILNKNNELENSYGIAMLMCDLSITAAKAGGLFFKDSSVEKSKRYVYRIKIAYTPPTGSIEPSVIITSYEDEKNLAEIKDLKVEFRDKTSTLSWSTLLHKGIYTAYYLERSTDGKNFKKLTDLPYVHMSEKLESETAFYVDSLEANQKKYFYRINGISPFAEQGPYSNTVSGEGKENLFGSVVLREGKVINDRQVSLNWEFPKELENQISGFMVSSAGNPDGPYNDLQKKALPKNIREFVDATQFNNTYYLIKAIDKNGEEITRSFPYLVQIEDNTPPAIPVGLNGTIEKNGLVTLSWDNNTDLDLLGYRLFRNNSNQEEPVEITQDILAEPTFKDTINVRVLDKKIYYSVIAVDKNYNTSGYSQTISLVRPDILPPTAPVFTKIELVKDSVLIEWLNSVSNDIESYELIRIEKESATRRTIKTWRPTQPVDKYSDRSLTPGHTFSYKIIVYDSAKNRSETVSKEIVYEPGFRKSVTNIKSSVDRITKTIALQWNNNEPGIKCIIYKKINDNPFSIYQTINGNIESFTDKAININNTYSYKIQIIYAKGAKSLASPEIKIIY
jgi:hypothetical protein